ncbi:MAG TPA: hypothetical protein PLG79_09965 [Spirochaetales bacterium]|nr:hypothetical protein [Spirochaetales bacterium]
MKCHFCNTEVPTDTPIYRSSLCSHCGKEIRICLNCVFYLPGAHWDCRESIPDPVFDKERANFCEFFRPASGGTNTEKGSTQKDSHGRDRFNSLFKE